MVCVFNCFLLEEIIITATIQAIARKISRSSVVPNPKIISGLDISLARCFLIKSSIASTSDEGGQIHLKCLSFSG